MVLDSRSRAQAPAHRRKTAESERLPGKRRPRLGFLGVGWIGRNRMNALAQSAAADIVAVADFDQAAAASAAAVEGAAVARSLEDLLEMKLDGIVIATPTALHASQAIAALESGAAVFCQKPLGRTAAEVRRVLAAARQRDRLLGIDMSYRFVRAAREIRDLARAGAIGEIYAADLVFHNAYGPDKPWYYDPALAGGGCVIDLGIHLIDMALWVLDFPPVRHVTSRRFCQGKALPPAGQGLEDYALARIDFTTGATANLCCSWRLSVGRDAAIETVFYGTRGGLALRNVGGSFYDFRAERFAGTTAAVLVEPPDAWGGRAAVAWARRLAERPEYEPEIEQSEAVARILDAVYDRGAPAPDDGEKR